MSTPFIMARDINGYNGFGIYFCEDNFQMILAPNVAQNFTVPDNYQDWLIVFAIQPGATVWVANNVTAQAPTGAIASTSSQLNPTARTVKAGDVISLITSDATNDQVGISLYWLRQ